MTTVFNKAPLVRVLPRASQAIDMASICSHVAKPKVWSN